MKTLSFALLALLALVFNPTNEQLTKEELLHNCIDSNPTDTGCDSCFFHVYGYYDTVPSYSYGHYACDPANLDYRIR